MDDVQVDAQLVISSLQELLSRANSELAIARAVILQQQGTIQSLRATPADVK